jgi:hypothetical protein
VSGIWDAKQQLLFSNSRSWLNRKAVLDMYWNSMLIALQIAPEFISMEIFREKASVCSSIQSISQREGMALYTVNRISQIPPTF